MAALRNMLRTFANLNLHGIPTCTKQHALVSFQPSFQLVSRGLRQLNGTLGVSKSSALNEAWPAAKPEQEVVEDPAVAESAISKDVIERVNAQIKEKSHGRLFAVVHVAGKQFRVTDGDLLMVEGTFAPTIGDALRLEKVLLVGSRDFTLLGRPILRPDLVRVEATVVEKSLTHTKVHFKKKRRKQYMRINFYRIPFTTLRINCVQFDGLVDQLREVEGTNQRVF